MWHVVAPFAIGAVGMLLAQRPAVVETPWALDAARGLTLVALAMALAVTPALRRAGFSPIVLFFSALRFAPALLRSGAFASAVFYTNMAAFVAFGILTLRRKDRRGGVAFGLLMPLSFGGGHSWTA